ncbi:MAG TPA: type II secretion system F family protein [Candidatus Didemnitutus sp.]|jgi:type IV pilus assembly protein PilC
MPDFEYHAVDAAGGSAHGMLAAPSENDASAQLAQRGLFPLRIHPQGAAGAKGGGLDGRRAKRGGRRRVRAREMAVFIRQLATLLKAGLPLVRALETLARQERNSALREMMTALAADIRAGLPLSEALARRGQRFDRLQVNLVKAGEAAGALEAVLDRLAGFMEKSLALRGKLKAALVYPACILTVAAAIMVALLVFVVPRFRQIFADLLKGAPLPPLTRAVIAVSDAVSAHFVLLAATGVVLGFAFRWLARTARGRRWRDLGVLHLPLVGDLVLKSLVARCVRTLATLLASGVPILPALAIARDACGNERVAAALDTVRARVTEGSGLAGPVEDAGVFPPLVTSMIDVGEHTGQLPEMLGRVAEIYEGEVDVAAAGLGALLEPLLIVVLAAIVGTIVLALFLPIIRIVQLLS